MARPDEIILFGSAARGQMPQDSDIDLLIARPLASNLHEAAVQIRYAIGNVKLPVDVILIATERFESTKNIIGGIACPAHRYGSMLYEAA